MVREKEANDNVRRQLPKRVPPLTVSRAFGQKSPLIDADLQAFLTRCLTDDHWQAYSNTERNKILESLPQSRRTDHSTHQNDFSGTHNSAHPSQLRKEIPEQKPDVPTNDMTRTPFKSFDVDSDPYVKRAIARFKRDLGDGYYEKTWQDKAQRAHQERMNGKFDDYIKEIAETMFEDDGSLDDNGDGDQDELAQISEDGEYLDTSRKGGRGRGRPRKAR